MPSIPAKLPVLTASVTLQEWTKDTTNALQVVPFDATDAVLGLSLKEMLELEDFRDSSDNIVRESYCPEFENHDGPFEVEVVEAIGNFLAANGVPTRDYLTPKAWSALQDRYRNRPTTPFTVTVNEKATRARTFMVHASSPAKACKMASEIAAKTFSEGWAKTSAIATAISP